MGYFNHKIVFRLLGFLLLIQSAVLLLMTLIPLLYAETDAVYFLQAALCTLSVGAIFVLVGKTAKPTIGKREGSVIVSFTWILFSLFGLLPFWLSGAIPSFTDAFFETMSGYTTTGASILNNIESLTHGMLFWRSVTHWIGGLGIIVISLAVLPLFGINGTQLFAAEATGPTTDKIHPKIGETAKRLLLIYILLTLTESVFLRFGGMGWFDAICHSFSTIATGGFSTKQASIGYWNSTYIQYVITFFMILSGINFSLYFFAFKNKWDKVKSNEELKVFLIVLLIFSTIITLSLIDFSALITWQSIEHAWRNAVFTVSSLLTTTGFVTVDYMHWKPFTWILLLLAMLTGASAGSTSGGIKMIRVVISVKAIYYEFLQLIHPKAVIPLRYSGQMVRSETVSRVVAFTLLYLMVVAIGIFVLALTGMGFQESIGGTITCLGGVGPGLGLVGPAGNFAHVSDLSKWFLSFIMLIGRLELFTVLVLFTKAFWRK